MTVLETSEVTKIVAAACAGSNYHNRKVLVIVPDGTRTAPIGLVLQELPRQTGAVSQAFAVMVALGTHQPMSEAAICQRLEISPQERQQTYKTVRFFNHAWNDPGELVQVGKIKAKEI